MSIFGQILAKIFPPDHPTAQAQRGESGAPTPSGTAQPSASAQPAPTGPVTAPAGSARPMDPVDVADVLAALSKVNPGFENWKTSIVDLMKLLGLSSDLATRKELAKELGYAGDTGDTATMNVWLHRQVMAKLAANGGIVPAELKD